MGVTMIDLTEPILRQVIQPRPAESHKGTFGRVLVVGGNEQYGGAGIMSASAALFAGAGLVTLASAAVNRTALHARHPEIMFLDWAETAALRASIQSADVIVVGPGLGLDPGAQALLRMVFTAVSANQSLIVDGSALTLVAGGAIPLPQQPQLILTPHQEEWHRLSGLPIARQTVSANQTVLAQLPATTILVLKQHRTQIYAGQEVFRNTTGVAAMATGGMGDTLTGIIAAFCAQFGQSKKPLPATLAAVYLHGLAGQELAQDHYVTLPSQICPQLPILMARFSCAGL